MNEIASQASPQEQTDQMNLAMFSAVFCCFVIRGLRASVLTVGMFSFRFLVTQLRSCRSAAARAAGARGKARETERSRDVKERPHGGRFFQTRPRGITKSGRSNQWWAKPDRL